MAMMAGMFAKGATGAAAAKAAGINAALSAGGGGFSGGAVSAKQVRRKGIQDNLPKILAGGTSAFAGVGDIMKGVQANRAMRREAEFLDLEAQRANVQGKIDVANAADAANSALGSAFASAAARGSTMPTGDVKDILADLDIRKLSSLAESDSLRSSARIKRIQGKAAKRAGILSGSFKLLSSPFQF